MKSYARNFFMFGLVLALGFASCATTPPAGTGAPGTARITLFSVVSLSNPHANLGAIPAVITEGEGKGLIHAILPGGTSTIVKAKWAVKGGSLWIGGERLTAAMPIDLGKTGSITALDRMGNAREYALDIREAKIPTVYLHTQGGAPILTKTDWVLGTLSIIGGETSGKVILDEAPMKIRGRGNSTWGMPKKPYRFTLDTSTPVLGIASAKKWVLLANYADKSLMRNFVAFDTVPVLDAIAYSPDQQPVVVYLNGEYQGVYGIGEQVETAKGRVSIAKPDKDPDTSFMLEVNNRAELEGLVKDEEYFVTPGGVKLELKTPDPEDLVEVQMANISAHIAAVEKAILSRSGYRAYIDVPSFIDWLIMVELFKNQDSIFLSSVYMHRDKGGLLKMGPFWDFDLAAGNSDYGAIGGYAIRDPSGWFATYSDWYTALLRDPSFAKAYADRWFQVRDALEKTVFSSIDTYSGLLADVQGENFKRWPIMGVYVWPNPPELVAADTHAKQVDALKAWFSARFAWIDKEIRSVAP